VATPTFRIGIDVGGTFTDLVPVHDGAITLEKHPTTPRRQRYGVPERLDFRRQRRRTARRGRGILATRPR